MSGVKAVAWIRFCSDGLYEGPIHDCQIDDIRRRSGVWTPLVPKPEYDTLRAQLEAAEAEVKRLIGCLTQANHNAEEFERKWYLAGDEADDYGNQRDDAIARAEAAEAECARLRVDADRMDWLVSHSVEVRYPLRHGSRHLFHAQQLNDECDEHETDLRAQIDAAMARTKEETK